MHIYGRGIGIGDDAMPAVYRAEIEIKEALRLGAFLFAVRSCAPEQKHRPKPVAAFSIWID